MEKKLLVFGNKMLGKIYVWPPVFDIEFNVYGAERKKY